MSNVLITKPIRVLSIGRLIECKGHEYLIRAIDVLNKRGVFVYCVIVGDGVLKKKLTELAWDLELEHQIFLTGELFGEDILKEYHQADIYVQPSVKTDTGEDGAPVTPCEAQAMGVPTIVTNIGGCPEQIEDGVTGFVCKERDPEDLADKIIKVIQKGWC